jgi:NDP-sugar pyrophosphorylase family protein
MPMAGLGKRFSMAGYETPKPLILVDDTPIFLKAIESFNTVMDRIELTLVIRKEIEEQWNISQMISNLSFQSNIILVDRKTGGAAETAFCAADKLSMGSPLLIMDCDIFFESREFIDAITNTDTFLEDGALLSFQSKDPRFSFVRKKGDIAVEVAEKRAISSEALIGAYYFRDVDRFKEYCQLVLSDGLNESHPEYYVSRVVQKAIEDNLAFRVFSGKFKSFGTPEELIAYKNQNFD